MFKATAMIIIAISLMQACSGSSVKQPSPANVTSTPSGATVYANELKLGVTPLHYEPYKAFPAGWRDAMYQAQGVLKVKMNGCEEFALKVNDYILSKPIHAELKCSEPSTPERSTATALEKTKSVVTPVVLPLSATEKRLEELEALYEKGIITKQEYNTTRERILNEL